MGPDITRLNSSWNSELLSQVRNIPGIGFRLSTSQLMIKVSYMQPYTQLILKINQDVEQTH
jgi:hypothetical protein